MKKFFGLMLAMALLLMPALGVFASGQAGTGGGTTTLIRTDDPNNFNPVGTWPAVKQKAASRCLSMSMAPKSPMLTTWLL